MIIGSKSKSGGMVGIYHKRISIYINPITLKVIRLRVKIIYLKIEVNDRGTKLALSRGK